jgi:hypothetical protein
MEDILYVTAQSAHAEADWYLDVYGEESGYIGTLGGHITNGTIEVVWDLIGPDSQSYAEESSFQFVVETVFDDEQGTNNAPEPQAIMGASATSPYSRKNRDRWAAPGDWVVANQNFWATWNGGDNLDLMTDAFANLGRSFGRAVRPSTSSGEAFRINYGDSTEASTWQTFRQALYHPYSRNLFYSGHGDGHGIGYNADDTNVFIKRKEIERMLNTNPGNTNRHAFRFVFIDGCETATGNLPQAFGIIREENLSLDHYLKSGERLSAYVGWNKSPTAAFYWGKVVYPGHWIFVQNFLYNWTTGIYSSVREALNHSGFGPLGNSSIDPDKLTVFGYQDLGVNQENGR